MPHGMSLMEGFREYGKEPVNRVTKHDLINFKFVKLVFSVLSFSSRCRLRQALVSNLPLVFSTWCCPLTTETCLKMKLLSDWLPSKRGRPITEEAGCRWWRERGCHSHGKVRAHQVGLAGKAVWRRP